MDSLVSAEWLAAHLDDPDLVVVDCRITMTEQGPAPAHRDYATAHVPGAIFADLVNDLSDTTHPIGFAVPTPAAFCEAMGRLGVGDDSQVVLYDDRMQLAGMTFSSIWAARVWWMLRWVGFDSAALLDGGFGTWRDGRRPVSSAVETAVTATLTPRPRPQLIVGQDEGRTALGDPEITLVDTLPPSSYDGSAPSYARPGHITGAINLPVSICTMLTADSFPTRRSRAATLPWRASHHHLLRRRHRSVGHRVRPHADRPPRRRGVHGLAPGVGCRPGQSDGDRTGARRLLATGQQLPGSRCLITVNRSIVRHAQGR